MLPGTSYANTLCASLSFMSAYSCSSCREVFVEVVVGSLLALWGGIGDFKLEPQ